MGRIYRFLLLLRNEKRSFESIRLWIRKRNRKEIFKEGKRLYQKLLRQCRQDGLEILSKEAKITKQNEKDWLISGQIRFLCKKQGNNISQRANLRLIRKQRKSRMETHEVILEIPLEHERNLFGGLDCHVKKIERTLRISVILRDGAVKLVGSESAVEQAKNIFSELTLSERGNTITEQNVDYVLALSKEHSDVSLAEIDKELIGYTIQGKPIKPKTRGQQKYVNQIREK